MRVAVFTDNDFDKVNGVTTTLKAALRHAPPGVALRIYTADGRGTDTPEYLALRAPGIPIPFYGEMKIYWPRVGAYVRRAQADRIDLIHLTTPGPIGLAAIRVAKVLGVPIVGTFHTDLTAYTTLLSGSRVLGTVMRELMRQIYGRCDHVLVPSESTRRLLAGTTNDAQPIGIWTRGVDPIAFSPAWRSEQLRKAWNVSDSRPAILYVGRVSREKGLALLPDLQRHLQFRGVAHRFVVVGDGPMRAELRSQLTDAVFTGSLNREEVAVAFASADLFVFPSRTDTAGNVVLEAQASGLPVLVSDAGGPRENMLHGRTGYVVAGTDAGHWSDYVASMIRDADVRGRLGVGAREYARSRSWDAALAPLYRTYADVLRAHRSAARGTTGARVRAHARPEPVPLQSPRSSTARLP
jgi:glycosyltransferase involved in cell wall biosynthesis